MWLEGDTLNDPPTPLHDQRWYFGLPPLPLHDQKWYFSLPPHPRLVCIILEQPPNQWGSFALLRYNFPTGMKSMDYTSSSCRGGGPSYRAFWFLEHFDFRSILIFGAFWFLEHHDVWSIWVLIFGKFWFLEHFVFEGGWVTGYLYIGYDWCTPGQP